MYKCRKHELFSEAESTIKQETLMVKLHILQHGGYLEQVSTRTVLSTI